MRRTRASLWILGVTVATAAVLFVLPITPKIAVESVPITRGSLVRLLSVEGTVTRRQETPVVALVGGRVAEVCVRQGQSVRQGELLLRLDTTLEEAALQRAARLQQELNAATEQTLALPAGLAGADALRLLAGSSELELLASAEECRLAIQAKQVRAERDGLVGQVYVQPGDYAAPGNVAMTVYQSGVQVTAVQRAQDCAEMRLGTRALVTQNGTSALAELCAFGEPIWEESLGGYQQTLTFEVEAGAALQLGSPAELDILRDASPDVPVAPLDALTGDGTLWVIRDGKAYEERVDARLRDANQVQVPERLLGLSVILTPDEERLSVGASVKERRK